jgi:hypothetical protein
MGRLVYEQKKEAKKMCGIYVHVVIKRPENKETLMEAVENEDNNGAMVIPMPGTQSSSRTPAASVPLGLSANTKTIQVVDMKETRLNRGYYSNLRSAAVMLSRLKGDLGKLDDPPDVSFLGKLALGKKDYAGIRRLNQDIRKKGALDVITISNGDSIVLQAHQIMVVAASNIH